jgi:hypothetical protein
LVRNSCTSYNIMKELCLFFTDPSKLSHQQNRIDFRKLHLHSVWNIFLMKVRFWAAQLKVYVIKIVLIEFVKMFTKFHHVQYTN